jgi:hypothetical protein
MMIKSTQAQQSDGKPCDDCIISSLSEESKQIQALIFLLYSFLIVAMINKLRATDALWADIDSFMSK